MAGQGTKSCRQVQVTLLWIVNVLDTRYRKPLTKCSLVIVGHFAKLRPMAALYSPAMFFRPELPRQTVLPCTPQQPSLAAVDLERAASQGSSAMSKLSSDATPVPIHIIGLNYSQRDPQHTHSPTISRIELQDQFKELGTPRRGPKWYALLSCLCRISGPN